MSGEWPPTIQIDGVRWVEIGQAAKFSRTKSAIILAAVDAKSISSVERDGKTFIQFAAASRLKRETAAMRTIKRNSALGDTLPIGNRQGPISAHREKQLPLPMSSGRKGRGWGP